MTQSEQRRINTRPRNEINWYALPSAGDLSSMLGYTSDAILYK